jgi:hypothetical protein
MSFKELEGKSNLEDVNIDRNVTISVMCVICVLYFIVVPLLPGKLPFSVKIIIIIIIIILSREEGLGLDSPGSEEAHGYLL